MVETAESVGEETHVLVAAVTKGLPKRTITRSKSENSVEDYNDVGYYKYTYPAHVYVRIPLFFPLQLLKKAIREEALWRVEDLLGRNSADDIGAEADAEDLAMEIFHEPEVLTAILGGFVRGLNTEVKDFERTGDSAIGELDNVQSMFWENVDSDNEYPDDHPDHEDFAPEARLATDLAITGSRLENISAEGEGLFAGVRATVRYTFTPLLYGSSPRIVTPRSRDWSEWA